MPELLKGIMERRAPRNMRISKDAMAGGGGAVEKTFGLANVERLLSFDAKRGGGFGPAGRPVLLEVFD